MRLRAEALTRHLEGPLRPLYVITGDEPLLTGEAADAIRAAARRQGFEEREVLEAGADFEWGALDAAAGALSLFAVRRLLDLRLPSGKPGDDGGKALSRYAAAPPEDTLLLLTLPRLDRQRQKSKWFQSLERCGAVIPIWPPRPNELPGWVQGRMERCGLRPTPEAVELLVSRTEGNLLACAQEIEKLRLLRGEGAVDGEAVREAVADAARFDLFSLADEMLGGEVARTVRILDGLRAEGVAPAVVLWLLAREIRALAGMSAERAAGAAVGEVMAKYKVWERRRPLVGAALQRHPLRRWRRLLHRAGGVDRIIKGEESGDAWDELLQLALLVAGKKIA